ncbi:hypothetical protein EDEG_00921 [Edhazardia aedis USNM 41457]|uniref:SAM-dependent MTase RsmB/NOP-type domain-containing protein n=1 Tax=Edhazardia aedis (strain USNM 41457) TaxID=1003232 RepID=J9DB00_EDHAE|nr:hypothetical protein EDEG_00921 [Edhazardia aedis USNM 41457]|eukprot:EJW04946.1 hypothetical protein EDEG_00921 [Edhazardia aedis USNM 41457]
MINQHFFNFFIFLIHTHVELLENTVILNRPQMLESSYNDYLREKLEKLFGKEECMQFMEESEKSRPTVIRTNTLKIRRKDLAKLLIGRGMDVDPLEWCKEGLVVYKSAVPVGATPEYLCGLYSVQGASSFLPVLNMDLHDCNKSIANSVDTKQTAEKVKNVKSTKDEEKFKDTTNNNDKTDIEVKNIEVANKLNDEKPDKCDEDREKTVQIENKNDLDHLEKADKNEENNVDGEKKNKNTTEGCHNKKDKRIKKQNNKNIKKDVFRVLDMCAAPGGKTTHIAALMQNNGILYANDIDKERCKAIQSNLSRLGITNTVVMCQDGRELNLENFFDRILLDAPCSGTGIISKDPDVKINRSDKDIKNTVKTQKDLIMRAFKMLKVGGVLVYSTCSVLVDENEAVVNFLIKKDIGARLMELNTTIGRNGFTKFRGDFFHPSMKMARRIYPHVNNMDGFFVAKLTKYKKT